MIVIQKDCVINGIHKNKSTYLKGLHRQSSLYLGVLEPLCQTMHVERGKRCVSLMESISPEMLSELFSS